MAAATTIMASNGNGSYDDSAYSGGTGAADPIFAKH